MDIKKFRNSFIFLTGTLLSTSSTVFAGADSGFYIGGGVGDASVDAKEVDFDESDSAYKVFGGYNFGVIPLIDLAVEASYVDFGTPSRGGIDVEITGLNAFGLAGLSFGPFGIFAKAGMIDWDVDVSGNISDSDSGTDPAYGVGARFALGSFAVRAQYERYDVDQADVEMLSVSAVFTF
jgi:hypothetical protein